MRTHQISLSWLGIGELSDLGPGLRYVSVEALLSAVNLTKHYKDVVALNDVSFDISDGITGILGENGAGKSTAIKIFLGAGRLVAATIACIGVMPSRTKISSSRCPV